MIINFILILIINIVPYANAASPTQPNVVKTKKNFYLINNSLEKLESNLRNEDHKQICKESFKTSKLITSNINGLKKIEPDYNWLEIRKVLFRINAKYCP